VELMKDQDLGTQNPPADTPPEAVGEQQPVDPNVVGKLNDQEMAGVQSLQQQAMNLQMQIGGLEVRKAHMLGMMQQLKDQGQAILDAAASRLGIKPGEQWSVSPDGVIRKVPRPAAPVPGPNTGG